MTLSPGRPFLISPPFGAYLRHPRAYSVLGSYTRLLRPGRALQVLRSVRPLGREPDGEPKGWVNKVGLRNPGWDSVAYPKWEPHQITSIAMVQGDEEEWNEFLTFHVMSIYTKHIEINVSCPNTNHPMLALASAAILKRIIEARADKTVIWKLPPVPSSVDAALRLADLGARYVHLSNTLPTPAGGFSGKFLREVNLPLVDRTANMLANAGMLQSLVARMVDGNRCLRNPNGVEIIAGGGIYAPNHIRQYQSAGASRFSLATAFMRPWRGYRLLREMT